MENPFDPENDEGFQAISRRLPGVDEETIKDYVEDAWARALEAAPCISDTEFPEEKEGLVKAILRSIILRWHDNSTGVVTGRMAGPYQVQLAAPQKKGYYLQPAEILDLQGLCRSESSAFSFSTIPAGFNTSPLHGVVINEGPGGYHPPGEWSPVEPDFPGVQP